MIGWTLLGAAAVVALVWSEYRGDRVRLVAKPAASACFLAVAAVGADGSAYSRWVFVALGLSALGDVALLGRSTAAFMAGLTSFLLAHVAYVIAFSVRGLDSAATVAAAVGVGLAAVVVVRWLWPHVPSPMRAPVAAYCAVISAMVATAVGTVVAEGDPRIVVAALGFYGSDLSVARDRFAAPGPANRIWGLPLYYAAQFLFAWTVT